MPGWAKRFLKVRKEEKSTTDDSQEGSFDNAMKLLEQLKQPTEADLASLKKGQKIRFYYFVDGSSDAYWMEGRIAQRVTKSSRTKSTNYSTNRYNIDQLRPIITFGSGSGTYPSEISINLAPNQCWEFASDSDAEDIFSITDDGEKVFQLDAGEVAETGNILPTEEEQQIEGQTAGQAMTDRASAITKQQQDGVTNLPAYQNSTRPRLR